MARDKASKNPFVDPDLRKVFLSHVETFSGIKKRDDSVKKSFRALSKDLKNDGFTMAMIKDAYQMQTPEGEAKFKAQVANRMLAAAYVGAAIGEQLSLFLDEPRVPAIDQAAKDGQAAAMRSEAHNPPYDSSVPQYQAWSDAFYAEQERQVKAGISKLDAKKAKASAGKGKKAAKPAKGATWKKRGRPAKVKPEASEDAPAAPVTQLITKQEKEAAAAARAPKVDDSPPRRPAAQPVTRASLKAQRESARDEAEAYFTKSPPAGNA